MVQKRPVHVHVGHVHNVVGQALLRRCPLDCRHGLLGVDALRGSHVKALGRLQAGGFVKGLEIHLVPACDVFAGDASRPVGLVGDRQIEGRRVVRQLRFAHLVERVVRAEHDLDPSLALTEAFGNRPRSGDHIAGEFGHSCFVTLALAAGGIVRADHHRGHLAVGVRQPFAAGLRNECNGRRREQNQSCVRHHALGEP